MKPSQPEPDIELVAEAVRREDSDRYMVALFQPKPMRRAAVALAAWNLELARARPRSGEATIGLMRLQWHRDALKEIAEGSPRRHPVIGELAAAHGEGRFRLEDLEGVIEARERDLDPAPAESLAALEAYARATAGALHRALWHDTPAAQAAEDAGTAFALIGLARAESVNQARGRPWAPRALKGGLRPIVDRAAELAAGAAPIRGCAGARAPAVLAEGYCARALEAKADPTDRRMAEPDPRRLWRLTAARWKRRL